MRFFVAWIREVVRLLPDIFAYRINGWIMDVHSPHEWPEHFPLVYCSGPHGDLAEWPCKEWAGAADAMKELRAKLNPVM